MPTAKFEFTNTSSALDGAATVFGVCFNLNVESYLISVGQISVFPHVTAMCVAYATKVQSPDKGGSNVSTEKSSMGYQSCGNKTSCILDLHIQM